MSTVRAQIRAALPYAFGLGAYLCTMIVANAPQGVTYDVAQMYPRLVQVGRIAACLVVAASVLIARGAVAPVRLAGLAAVLVALPMACGYAPTPAESVVAHAGQTWLPGVAAVVEGAGGALVALGFLALLVARSGAVAIAAVPFSMAISHVIYMLLGLLPASLAPWSRVIAMAAAVVLLMWCAWRDGDGVQAVLEGGAGGFAGVCSAVRTLWGEPSGAARSDQGAPSSHGPWSSLLIVAGCMLLPFVYVLVCSMALETQAGSGEYWTAVEWSVVAVLVAVALVALRLGEGRGLDVGVLALNAAFATAMLVVSVFSDDFMGTAAALLQGGFFLYNAPLWMYVARAAGGSFGRALATFGLVNATLHLSALVGSVAGGILSGLAAQTALLVTRVAFIGVWLVAMALLVLFLLGGRLVAPAGDGATPNASDRFAEGCASLALSCGLSEREEQIMATYARGRSASHIAEDLFISEETVKTHIKHIYAKVGVHSRQELLDRIEG